MAKQVVVVQSDKARGNCIDLPCLPYHEETPLQGRHSCGVSKSRADVIALGYTETSQICQERAARDERHKQPMEQYLRLKNMFHELYRTMQARLAWSLGLTGT